MFRTQTWLDDARDDDEDAYFSARRYPFFTIQNGFQTQHRYLMHNVISGVLILVIDDTLLCIWRMLSSLNTVVSCMK